MVLSQAHDRFLRYCAAERNHSPQTIKAYRHASRRFLEWLLAHGHGDPAVSLVTAEIGREYLYHLYTLGLRPRTVLHLFLPLRALYRMLVKQKYASANPFLEVDLPKKDVAQRLLITEEELETLLEAAGRQGDPMRAARDQAVFVVMIFCGLRRAELLNLHLADITGREGNVVLVNGQLQPTVSLRSGEEQRWRVVNTSAGRYYRLSLAGHSFQYVGSDGGLFERPVEVNDILLAPADRVELLVRGTGVPGSQVVLQSLPYDRYRPDFRPGGWKTPLNLLTVQYTRDEPDNPAGDPRCPAAGPRSRCLQGGHHPNHPTDERADNQRQDILDEPGRYPGEAKHHRDLADHEHPRFRPPVPPAPRFGFAQWRNC